MDKFSIINKLEKLAARRDFNDPSRLPSGECRDVTTHLCGIFLKVHIGTILEALKRMD
jgi:hypothetical protein